MFGKKFSTANVEPLILLGAMLFLGLPLCSHASPGSADAGPSSVSISPSHVASFNTKKFAAALLFSNFWSDQVNDYAAGVNIVTHDANIEKIMADFTYGAASDKRTLLILGSLRVLSWPNRMDLIPRLY